MTSNKQNQTNHTRSVTQRLNLIYDSFKPEDHLLICINADPDSISSAMALKRLLWRRLSGITIAIVNRIARPDNLAMVDLLKVPLVSFHNLDLKKFNKLAMVDSQPTHMDELADVYFDLVIDHHPLTRFEAGFSDIRPDFGATATIMTEYLRAAKIKPSRVLSTALFYGIKTDTQNFVRQGQLEDMRIFRYLFPFVNMTMINKIENSEMTRDLLKYFRKALDMVKVRKGVAWLYMEKVDNPDTLVFMADFFMKVHEINQIFCAGIFKDQVIVIYRTVGFRKDAGKLLAAAFGGIGSAGGHKTMARAEIPLAHLDPKILGKNNGMERYLRKLVNDVGRKK